MSSLDLIGRVEAAELDPGTYVVSVHGPIDARMAGELRDVVLPLAAADGTVLVLDLDDAHGLDFETLSVLGIAAHLVKRRGESLRIVTRSLLTRELFGESGMKDVVVISSSLREALVA